MSCFQVRYAPLETARVDETSLGECFVAASTSCDVTGAAGEQVPADSGCPSTADHLACSSSSGSSTSSTATKPTGSNSSDAGTAADSNGGSGSGVATAGDQQREFGRSVSGASNSSGNTSNDGEADSNEGSSGDSTDASNASFSGMMEEVLRDAFIKTDEEFSDSGLQAGLVGSTAVVALVGTHRVWIANCGEWLLVAFRHACMHACYRMLTGHGHG